MFVKSAFLNKILETKEKSVQRQKKRKVHSIKVVLT